MNTNVNDTAEAPRNGTEECVPIEVEQMLAQEDLLPQREEDKRKLEEQYSKVVQMKKETVAMKEESAEKTLESDAEEMRELRANLSQANEALEKAENAKVEVEVKNSQLVKELKDLTDIYSKGLEQRKRQEENSKRDQERITKEALKANAKVEKVRTQMKELLMARKLEWDELKTREEEMANANEEKVRAAFDAAQMRQEGEEMLRAAKTASEEMTKRAKEEARVMVEEAKKEVATKKEELAGIEAAVANQTERLRGAISMLAKKDEDHKTNCEQLREATKRHLHVVVDSLFRPWDQTTTPISGVMTEAQELLNKISAKRPNAATSGSAEHDESSCKKKRTSSDKNVIGSDVRIPPLNLGELMRAGKKAAKRAAKQQKAASASSSESPGVVKSTGSSSSGSA